MSEKRTKEYRAIIWKDPNQPGQRVSVWATDGFEAKRLLEEEYGEGTVHDLYNEEEESKPR